MEPLSLYNPRMKAREVALVFLKDAAGDIRALITGSIVLTAWGFLWPALKRIVQLAWIGQQSPLPLTAGWARISLLALLGIAISTIVLVIVAWRQRKELNRLLEHKCPEPISGRPQSYPGLKFKYDGVDWIPVLRYIGNDADDKIEISRPQCPDCSTPLIFFTDREGSCPNPDCMHKFYLQRPVGIVSEMARFDAIGRAARGELHFPGKPGFKPLLRRG